MILEQAIAFLMFSIVAAGTPGPANVLIVATAARVGVLRGIPCMLGVSIGTGLLLGIVALGLGSLVLNRPTLLTVMNIAGALFLLWLAWQIATAPTDNSAEAERNPVGFFKAALLQWINPKSWTVAVSAAGTYLNQEAGSPWLQAVTFFVLFVAGAIPACSLWLGMGAVMKNWLRTSAAKRRFNISMGVLLAASIVVLFI